MSRTVEYDNDIAEMYGTAGPSMDWIPNSDRSTYTLANIFNKGYYPLKGLYETIKALFGNDEAGGMWLPEPGYCWQDVHRTIPCTAPGDLVAFQDDISQGLKLGPELATNRTFDTDSDWGMGIGWTISAGKARYTGSSTARLTQNMLLSAGKTYRITMDVEGAGVYLLLGQNAAFDTGLLVGSVNVTCRLAPDATNEILFIRPNLNDCTVDNVSVRELKGNHAIQATEASRPALGRTVEGGRRNQLITTDTFADWTFILRN